MIEHLKKLKVHKVLCQDSLLFFTRYFFKKRYKRKFVIGDHHILIATALEKVLSGETKRLIVNIAPRYSKTELGVINFIAHALAVNPSALFLHLSYSQEVALNNSEMTRDLINTQEYQEMFPKVRIKKASTAKKKWYTEDGGGIYATAMGGQVTGFGAGKVDIEEEEEIDDFITSIEAKEGFGGAIVIDDSMKPDDADSSLARGKVNNKFDSTMVNRVNSVNTPIIIIGQRLHPEDLCGYVQLDNDEWTVLSLPCIYEEEGKEKSLWPFKHKLEELYKMREKNVVVFDRQYLQDPKPLKGLLYTKFLTYSEIDFEIGRVKSYTDTADTGSDFLCSIIYTEHLNNIYLLDVYYSDEPNEITEIEVAERHTRFNVNLSRIESNNGGRAFARNVERLCRDAGNYKADITWFHQSKNKEARIKSNSSTIQNTVIYPHNWEIIWRKFNRAMTTYMSAGKNGHDDAPDSMSGVVENHNEELVTTWH